MIWKDLLALSRREQKGYFILLSLVVIFLIIFLLSVSFSKWQKPEIKISGIGQLTDSTRLSASEIPQFDYFNPNTASIKQLELLGLKPRAILNWKKYLEANGQFYKPDDLYRIYSLDSAFVQKISPYLVFDSKSTPNTFAQNNSSKRDYPTSQWVDLNGVTAGKLAEFDITGWKSDSLIHWQSKYWFTQKVNITQLKAANQLTFNSLVLQYASLKKQPVDLTDNYSIELNQADTAELNLLDGIGPVIARRIVYYRKQLGGFYTFEQLQEVTGISPATMQKVKTHVTVNAQLITPINVNNASLRRLKEHPYLGYFKAKDIVEYRKAKGKITSFDEILQLNSFSNQQLDWIRYYLIL